MNVKERRGFIALGKLHDYADQVVFRHEQTLSKPKSDRLNLLKATRAHFGQIFMLYSDPAGSVEKILYDGTGPADAEVTDEYGVLHRIWRVSDPGGHPPAHHRHGRQEADHRRRPPPLRNGAELLQRNTPRRRRPAPNTTPASLPQPPYPEAAVMMTFVNMDSDGLVILPTHRVVHSLAGFDPAAFAACRRAVLHRRKAARRRRQQPTSTRCADQTGTAFVAVTRGGAFLLRSKPDAAARRTRRPARTPAPARPEPSALHHPRPAPRPRRREGPRANQLRYLRDAAEAVDQVRRGEADVAFLTNPVTMEQLREVAFAGDVMPQKSTDFFPKLLSGLTIYALE